MLSIAFLADPSFQLAIQVLLKSRIFTLMSSFSVPFNLVQTDLISFLTDSSVLVISTPRWSLVRVPGRYVFTCSSSMATPYLDSTG